MGTPNQTRLTSHYEVESETSMHKIFFFSVIPIFLLRHYARQRNVYGIIANLQEMQGFVLCDMHMKAHAASSEEAPSSINHISYWNCRLFWWLCWSCQVLFQNALMLSFCLSGKYYFEREVIKRSMTFSLNDAEGKMLSCLRYQMLTAIQIHHEYLRLMAGLHFLRCIYINIYIKKAIIFDTDTGIARISKKCGLKFKSGHIMVF